MAHFWNQLISFNNGQWYHILLLYSIRLRAGNYISHHPGQTTRWIFTKCNLVVWYISQSAKKYFFLQFTTIIIQYIDIKSLCGGSPLQPRWPRRFVMWPKRTNHNKAKMPLCPYDNPTGGIIPDNPAICRITLKQQFSVQEESIQLQNLGPHPYHKE